MDIAKRNLRGKMLSITSGKNISHAQLEVLFSIHSRQPINPTELATRLSMTPGAVSQLIDVLEDQRLITRQTDPDDRRRQVLTVSHRGVTLMKSIERRRRTVMENVIKDLTDEELQLWLKIQKKIINEFQKAHANIKEQE
jgi:DNA-binding MarR family transcriptional regulator